MKRLVASLLLAATASVANAADPLVSVDWVKENLGAENVVFLDVRGPISGSTKADYLRAHIPGAVYTNYAKDGWRTKNKEGTPGMLSPVDKLEKLIGGLGIDNDSHVVLLPAGRKAVDMGTATRIYWTFNVLGHDNVSILDGGYAAYTKKIDEKTKKPINPLDKGAVTPVAKTFKATLQDDMLVSKADIVAAKDAGVQIVDHRPHNQFLGINKHGKAKRGGTIPGAVNLPENWITNNGGGSFRSKEHLQQLFAAAEVSTEEAQISFCNSGHWASLGWFASHELLGNEQTRMYDGSMLEWTADASMQVEQHIKLD